MYLSAELYFDFFVDFFYAVRTDSGIASLHIKVSRVYFEEQLLTRRALGLALSMIADLLSIRVSSDNVLEFMDDVLRRPRPFDGFPVLRQVI